MKLTEEQITEKLAQAEDWIREDGKWIVRKYRFRTFLQAVAFVNEVAAVAEELNHHPMIAIDFKLVTLRLTTWSDGGLTELDMASAVRYNEAYAGMNKQS